MKIGLIGLSGTGKTTLFLLLTQANEEKLASSSKKFETSIGVAKVPDKRIDFLSGIYKQKKITYATIELMDVPGITPSDSGTRTSSINQFLDSVRNVDSLVQVLRVFEDKKKKSIFQKVNKINGRFIFGIASIYLIKVVYF